MALGVCREPDQLFVDIEGFEYELVHGEISYDQLTMIGDSAFEKVSAEYDLSSIFMEAVWDALRDMNFVQKEMTLKNGSILPRVYGNGFEHYVDEDDVFKFLRLEYGIEIDLDPNAMDLFEEKFLASLDGNCSYSDLIDNAMVNMAIELGFVRRVEDIEDSSEGD